jgi:putative phage-type endonuclease
MNTEMITYDHKQKIGGSECAAALGLSKWKTPYQLYCEKVSEEDVQNIDNEYMYWGRALEPLIIERYKEITNNQVQIFLDENNKQQTFVHSKYKWLKAHIDGLVTNKNLILEAKSTRFFNDEWGDINTDSIPIEYLIQCAHYCIVISEERKIEGADIAALGSTNDFRIYHYSRNKELEDFIIQKTHDFWHNHVLKLVPPSPTVNDDLNKIYANTIQDKVIATEHVAVICDQINEITPKIKELEEQENKLKTELKLFMQDKEELIDIKGRQLATWKKCNRKVLDNKALESSNIDLTPFYVEKNNRMFLIKKQK